MEIGPTGFSLSDSSSFLQFRNAFIFIFNDDPQTKLLCHHSTPETLSVVPMKHYIPIRRPQQAERYELLQISQPPSALRLIASYTYRKAVVAASSSYVQS